MAKSKVGNPVITQLSWDLFEAGMGILERAGLAGLYMSLQAVQEWADRKNPEALKLHQNLQWTLSDQRVTLSWAGDPQPALTSLLRWAWQVREGVFWLPGVHPSQDEYEHCYQRLPTHMGILQTFLQHPRVLGREKSPVTCNIQEDENRYYVVRYQKIKSGAPLPQEGILALILKRGFDNAFLTLDQSWLYPGAAKRFGQAAKTEEPWRGPAKMALLLLFAPLACIYLKLPQTPKGKDNWAFVIPDITNLETFAANFYRYRNRTAQAFLDLEVRSLGDAALRVACAFASSSFQKKLQTEKIYVVAMGKVGHYSNQSVRKRLLEFAPGEIAIKRYRLLLKEMPNTFRRRRTIVTEQEDNSGQFALWIRQPTPRGAIADNLIHQRPWYAGLLWPHEWTLDELEDQRQNTKKQEAVSLEHLWFNNLLDERRAFMQLANNPDNADMWDKPEEQDLLTLFHQSLRQILNQEEEAVKRGGSRTLKERWEDRQDEIRRGLLRAKTLELNRKFLLEILASGGGHKDLAGKKEILWRYLNDRYEWQKARDLALLALITFTDKRLGKTEETSDQEETNHG